MKSKLVTGLTRLLGISLISCLTAPSARAVTDAKKYPKEIQEACFRLEGVKMKCGGKFIPTPAPGDGGGGGDGGEGDRPSPPPPPVCTGMTCTYTKWVLTTGRVLIASSVKSTSVSCTPNNPPVRDGCPGACDCQNVSEDCNAIDMCPGQHAEACSCTKSVNEQDNTVYTGVDGHACLAQESISIHQDSCGACNSPPPGYGEPPPADACYCGGVCKE